MKLNLWGPQVTVMGIVRWSNGCPWVADRLSHRPINSLTTRIGYNLSRQMLRVGSCHVRAHAIRARSPSNLSICYWIVGPLRQIRCGRKNFDLKGVKGGGGEGAYSSNWSTSPYFYLKLKNNLFKLGQYMLFFLG